MHIAHKREDDKEEQSLKDHLEGTAIKAQEFGNSFNNSKYAYVCGMLHDIGKYSERFQKKIKENLSIRVDHSTAGAIEATKSMGLLGKLLAYCVAGHHGGIPDGGSRSDTVDDSTLSGRLKREMQLPVYSHYKNEIDTNFVVEGPPNITPLNKGGFSLSFFIRMLYSCLVDADFLDTEEFMNKGSIDRCINYDYHLLNKKLNNFIKMFKNKGKPINVKRSEILKNCIDKSKSKRGLFTLTVPTGGGKTISSFAFAINHVLENNMDRIIYVIPYTSIIEQTGKVFRDILGEDYVLEHHSNFDFKNDENSNIYKLKLSSENWDIPVIVTTNVQFFESLFSNKPSQCRKLHNIANSVIIFDEAQMIPTEYLTPSIMAIAELVKNYNSTCVLCSATQPPLKERFPNSIVINEICRNYKSLYEFFRRTKIIKRGKMDSSLLAEEMNNCKQVLCIVNNKKHALEIFSKLKGDGIFHLSTRMCPVHRKKVINDIRYRLKNELPCKVVSTQLIEAGVDVDFPIVYRAMAGIDSIIQAGGRCNREGNLELGFIHVFEPESKFTKNMPASIRRPIEVAKGIMERFEDILSPEAIEAYFKELYFFEGKEGLDIKGIYDELELGAMDCNFNFKQISKKYKLIDENSTPILIDLDNYSKDLINKLRYADNYKSLLRSMQPYTVNVYENEFNKMYGANILELINEEIYLLRDTAKYKKETGLEFTIETGIGIFV